MPAFHFDHRPERGELRVRLAVAEFDAAVTPDFKLALEGAWKPNLKLVILDLSAVDLIDSSGVGALLGVQKRLPAHSEAVRLVGARPAVIGVLELLHLQRVFQIG